MKKIIYHNFRAALLRTVICIIFLNVTLESSAQEDYSEAYTEWLNKEIMSIHSKLINCKGEYALEYKFSHRMLKPFKDENESLIVIRIYLSDGKYAIEFVEKQGERETEKVFFDGTDIYYYTSWNKSLHVGSLEKILNDEENKQRLTMHCMLMLPIFDIRKSIASFEERHDEEFKIVNSLELSIDASIGKKETDDYGTFKSLAKNIVNYGGVKLHSFAMMESYDNKGAVMAYEVIKLDTDIKLKPLEAYKISSSNMDKIYDYDTISLK